MPGEPLAKAFLVTSSSTHGQSNNQNSTTTTSIGGDFIPVYKVTNKWEKVDGSEKKMMVHFEFEGSITNDDDPVTESDDNNDSTIKHRSFASALNNARKSGYRLVNQLPQETGVTYSHQWKECCTKRYQEREIIAWFLKD